MRSRVFVVHSFPAKNFEMDGMETPVRLERVSIVVSVDFIVSRILFRSADIIAILL